MDALLEQWNKATNELPWGVQRAFVDVLTLASEGKTTLVYGADYAQKGACLVNQAANMLTTGGGYGIPMREFNAVVRAFDLINHELEKKAINDTPKRVSPLAAEILLRHFGTIKPEPVQSSAPEVTKPDTPYIEPTDAQLSEDFKKMFEVPAPLDITNIEHSDAVLAEAEKIINATPPF